MLYILLAVVIAVAAFMAFRKSPESDLLAKAKRERDARMIGDSTPNV